jgi:two-component system, NarL family, nitrate/nitrite response regulator NarL
MHKIKIIIVDDHPMVLEGMSAMLAQIEFVINAGIAANAYEAMQQIKTTAPDIVITDINMPEE